MEFWGVEVKAGEPLKVKPELGYVIHLSQACLGETKKDKGNDSVLLNLKVGDQKLVLGLLSLEKIPQLSFDLVFEKEFELSHNWKNGSVYFCGYQTQYGEENDFSDLDDSEEEEEDVPSAVTENGKGGQKVEQAKPASAKSIAAKPESSEKPKVKLVEPSKDEDDEDSDDDDDDDDSDGDEGSDDESDDEDMLDADSDDDDEGSDEEDEETPKKVESGKKRPNQSAVKTPVSVKKAKPDSAQKSGGKKGAPHTATPHPAKNAGKTPGTADKSKAQTPKSGGQFSCKSCSKSFGSENALQSHSKAKHAGN
ncbi:histone deacetylase HDT1 [Ziziphus jujuba]|uniref:Histone deacetylase HDT1 n=1 Tax=Ziziphus jujuba TaxID=326968 RepID=A0ABM3IBP5_ZIZJJ|nr:histone deacetylase HDT1 [Ziziphus jujuba]